MTVVAAGGCAAITRPVPVQAVPPGGENAAGGDGAAGKTRGGPDASGGVPPLARLRCFHPGWFGAVMGTAIVAVAAAMNPGQIAALAPTARTLSQVMVVLAAVLAAVLAVTYAGRWVVHRDAALADLRDPVAGALYGTLPRAQRRRLPLLPWASGYKR